MFETDMSGEKKLIITEETAGEDLERASRIRMMYEARDMERHTFTYVPDKKVRLIEEKQDGSKTSEPTSGQNLLAQLCCCFFTCCTKPPARTAVDNAGKFVPVADDGSFEACPAY